MNYIAKLSIPHIMPARKLVFKGKVIKEYPEDKLDEVAFNGKNKLKEFIAEKNYEDRVISIYSKSVDGKIKSLEL